MIIKGLLLLMNVSQSLQMKIYSKGTCSTEKSQDCQVLAPDIPLSKSVLGKYLKTTASQVPHPQDERNPLNNLYGLIKIEFFYNSR